jgi:hypothetical protein
MFGHDTKKSSTCDRFCDYFTCGGKEFDLSFHTLYKSDALATLGYFFLGSSRLDTVVISRTHPRSILAFTKTAGLR